MTQNTFASLLAQSPPSPLVALVFTALAHSNEILRAHANGMDVAELRVDYYKELPIETVVEQAKLFAGIPTIATLRTQAEGGHWNGSDAERLALFKALIPHVDAVDVELSSASLLKPIAAALKEHNKCAIISFHDFQHTPPEKELSAVIKKAVKAGATMVKIATQINSTADVHTLTRLLLDHADTKLTVIGMGPKGVITRSIFPFYGSRLTFSYIGNQTAPGQIPLHALVSQLRMIYPEYDERLRHIEAL